VIAAIRPYDRQTVREWGLREWDHRLVREALAANLTVLEFVRSKLGDPTEDEDDLVLWADETYQLFVIGDDDFSLDVPEGVADATAAKNLLWDLGLLPNQPLTRAEHQEWFQKGKALAEPHVQEFSSVSDDDLKQFVLAYCDGHVYTDHQAGSDAGMVFLPLAFGAFHVFPADPKRDREEHPAWEAFQKLPDGPGDKPKRDERPKPPEPPPAPERDPHPEKPREPVYEAYDEEHERKLRAEGAFTGEISSVEDLFIEGDGDALVSEYRRGIDRKNAVLRQKWQEDVEAWERKKAQIDEAHLSKLQKHRAVLAAHDRALTEHAAKVAEWEKRGDVYEQAVAEWKRQKAIREAALEGFHATRLQNLGCIYEEMSKTLPRGVNGKPMFSGCRILNRSDWSRCIKAIQRELERRESMEI